MSTATISDLANLSHTELPVYPPPVYSPAAGAAAIEALASAIEALAETELAPVTLDVEGAIYTALGVVGLVSAPDVRRAFEALPADGFDMDLLDGLGPACFATLYAIAEARAAGALKTRARVPAALAAEAAELERRMQALCEYHFSNDPEIKPELDRLRPGSGHRDLANDLLGYARIYALRADVVREDRTCYRDDDTARAAALAGAIIQGLSKEMTPRARAAYDRYVRAWTLLSLRYNEVRAAGLWRFRKDPRVEQRFPSLFAAGRPGCGRPRKGAPKSQPPKD